MRTATQFAWALLAALALNSVTAAQTLPSASKAPNPVTGAKGPTWLSGKLTNITTVRGAMLVMLDTGVPENCQGTPYGWMLIREQDKVMVNIVMAMWASDRRDATIYTVGMVGGWCEIEQVDPTG